MLSIIMYRVIYTWLLSQFRQAGNPDASSCASSSKKMQDLSYSRKTTSKASIYAELKRLVVFIHPEYARVRCERR